MTLLDERDMAVLRRARRGLSPTPDDESRVLASTLASAPLAAAGIRDAETLTSPPEASISRTLLGVLALGVVGLVGYGWGYRAGLSAQPAPAVAGPASKLRAALPDPPRAVTPVSESVLELPRGTARAVETTTSKQRAVATPSSSAISLSRPGLGLGLEEEVRQLRRIDRAVRDGNPRLALVLSEELDRAMPEGQLKVERNAAALMANCQLGTEAAATRAGRFIHDNPSSGYAARLREICKLPAEEQRK